MITLDQAAKLRTLIRMLVVAEIANSWRGGSDPAQILYIADEARHARTELRNFILSITEHKDQP